jgi:hypothetical protein
MKKFLIVIMMFLAIGSLAAQEDTAKKGHEPSAKAQEPLKDVPKQVETPVYKLAFAIYELQEGKRTNQRDYSLMIQADGRGANTLKIGTKVPVDTGNGGITYLEVGFDMQSEAIETVTNKLAVGVTVNLSNFAIPEANKDPHTAGNQPVIRGVTQRVRTVLTPGKPQVITSVDDPNSNKRIQVELTATKIE